jgi:hypothetical protein
MSKFRMSGSRMERETGFEPATSSLGSWHSTPELLPLRRIRSGKSLKEHSRTLSVNPTRKIVKLKILTMVAQIDAEDLAYTFDDDMSSTAWLMSSCH